MFAVVSLVNLYVNGQLFVGILRERHRQFELLEDGVNKEEKITNTESQLTLGCTCRCSFLYQNQALYTDR